MKQISSVFRRRKNPDSAAAATAAHADADNTDAKQPADSILPIGRETIIQRGQPSIKVIHIASNVNCAATPSATDSRSTPVVEMPEAPMTMKSPGHGGTVPRDIDKTKTTTTFNVDSTPFGPDQLLSAREQIWYKNQMYLLAKQQQAVSRVTIPPSRVESTSRTDGGVVRYIDDGFDRQRYSPRGVDDFESDGGMIQSNSKREGVRSNETSKGDYDYYDGFDDDDDDDTRKNLSRNDEDSCTTQFTSALDDDTRTYLSSLLFDEDESRSDSSELFNGVALDSAISGYTTATESVSLFSSLDDGTSNSYVFELVDDGGKQRRKYQLGVGHKPDISVHRKCPRSLTRTRRSEDRDSTSKTITAWPQMDRRKMNSTIDANSPVGDAECPLLQVFLEEVTGTYKDVKLALDQILHAFCISPDNVDQISDELSFARLELLDLCHKQGSRRIQATNRWR